jgi:hypothetical protein
VPRLEITKEVELRDGRLFAESDEPWLLLVEESLRRGRSRFIEMTYWVDAWRWALGLEPRSAYTGWRAARRPMGQSRARSGAPLFCEIFLDVGKASASQIDESCRVLER